MADCVRCLTVRKAAFLVSYTYEDTVYELDLCQNHVDAFDRDLMAWNRLARVVQDWAQPPAPPPPAPPTPIRVNSIVPFPVTDGGVEEKDGYPDPCPPDQVARFRKGGGPRVDPAVGRRFTERVLMQPGTLAKGS